MADGQVLIAYVHDGEHVAHSWHESMMGLAFHFVQSEHFGAKYPIRYGTGGLVQARNKAADMLLSQDEQDWLFWIDTDMGFEPDIVDRLMAVADPVERPIVGALCFINHEDGDDGMNGRSVVPKPTLFRWAKNPNGATGFTPMMDYPRNELVRVDATGSAALVIHRSVFEKIRDMNGGNYYGHVVAPNDDPSKTTINDVFSEDMSFCVRCAEANIPIYVHTGIKTSHCKLRWLSETEFDRTLAGMALELAPSPPTPRNRAERRAATKHRS